MPTAQVSEPIAGDKLYQQRARQALPVLVRQAWAGNTITYTDLAEELGMANARNLNFVLGSIGQTLHNLASQTGEEIPPLQSVVVNKATGFPGEGIGWFLVKEEEYVRLPKEAQRRIVKAQLARVFAYPNWAKVLDVLSLAAANTPLAENLLPSFIGRGEGEAHRALKEYVSLHPEIVGLKPRNVRSTMEMALLSGDCLDVSFESLREWIAVEVKGAGSPLLDIQRGLFQCVKYHAVMRAQSLALGQLVSVRAVLVLSSQLPSSLLSLKRLLDVEVIEGIVPK